MRGAVPMGAVNGQPWGLTLTAGRGRRTPCRVLTSEPDRGVSRMQGEAFRQARLKLRLSQAELRDALNGRLGRSYDKPRVSRWENGREAIPAEVALAVEALAAETPRNARVLA